MHTIQEILEDIEHQQVILREIKVLTDSSINPLFSGNIKELRQNDELSKCLVEKVGLNKDRVIITVY